MRRPILSLAAAAFLLALPDWGFADVDLAVLYAKTSPSIVTLTVYSQTGEKIAQGSGFIVDKDGIIVTCNHVIANAATVEVKSADGTTHLATAVLCTDRNWDVALLKVDPLPQPPLQLAHADAIVIGAPIVAIGSPLGYGNTISQGIISGLRTGQDTDSTTGPKMIQITAPISPGSSGGPILSASTQEVLGMTVASEMAGQNINFAIPADVISTCLKAPSDPPERKLGDFTADARAAIAKDKKTRDSLETECTEEDAKTINTSIQAALDVGVGIYNAGDHRGCFRMYEGAAYKILYLLKGRSQTAADVLNQALNKVNPEDSPEADTANAWTMRYAFDSIIGVHGHKVSLKPVETMAPLQTTLTPTSPPKPVTTNPAAP